MALPSVRSRQPLTKTSGWFVKAVHVPPIAGVENPLNALDAPLAVVNVIVRVVLAALAAMVMNMLNAVDEPFDIVAVTPDPLNATERGAPVKLVPVIVARKEVPGSPDVTVRPVIVGSGKFTGKLNATDVNPPAVTISVCTPGTRDPDTIVMVIGSDVAVPLPTVAVTPTPENVTAVAPVSPVPVIVAEIVVR